MAYSFARTSSQYLNTVSTPVTTYPTTFAAFYKTSNTTANQTLVSIATLGATNFFLNAEGNGNDKINAYSNSNVPSNGASTSITYPTSTWFSGAAVFSAANSRAVYLDGGSSGTNTTNTASTGLTRIGIGALIVGGIVDYADGDIAEVAIWNVVLTDGEIASLGKGFKASRIRPQSLVFYAPLIRDLQDTKGALAITNNNTATVAVHPRVI
jgi:hypothetical protein